MPTYPRATLDNKFDYHKPDYEKGKSHELVRHECRILANAINNLCPASIEANEAIKCVELAMFWANAAIARHKDV